MVGPFSAIQPDILLPLGIEQHEETSVRVPQGKLLCAANIRRPGKSNLHKQATPLSNGASVINFLCPEKFKLGQCLWDLNHGPLDL